ncbi:MAG: plasmid pRiA4b ORF-3 family protein [Candidatus Freyarchaeota archaeon]
MRSPKLEITDRKPTPLVKDFDTFTQFIVDNEVVLTRREHWIPAKVLYEINQRMTHPVKEATPKTAQPGHPLLNLFYHLALAGRLFRKAYGAGGYTLRETGRLQLFRELTPAEKYFFLLETLWVDTNWEDLEIMRGPHPVIPAPITMSYLAQRKPGKKIDLDRLPSGPRFVLGGWSGFLLYFSYFGFWNVTFRAFEKNGVKTLQSFSIDSIKLTPLGKTLIPILLRVRNPYLWNLPFRHSVLGEWRVTPGTPTPKIENILEFVSDWLAGSRMKLKMRVKVDEGSLGEPFFQPFVHLLPKGHLQRSLPHDWLRFVDGSYTFKVSLSKNVWRRIRVSADHTLLDLHHAIQMAYDFDSDHLYSFFMDGKMWSSIKFTSPMEEERPHVDEARIGELGLYEGQNILYLFDYGDKWRFRVELEKIDPEGPKPQEPEIIEEKGRSPPQYEW